MAKDRDPYEQDPEVREWLRRHRKDLREFEDGSSVEALNFGNEIENLRPKDRLVADAPDLMDPTAATSYPWEAARRGRVAGAGPNLYGYSLEKEREALFRLKQRWDPDVHEWKRGIGTAITGETDSGWKLHYSGPHHLVLELMLRGCGVREIEEKFAELGLTPYQAGAWFRKVRWLARDPEPEPFEDWQERFEEGGLRRLIDGLPPDLREIAEELTSGQEVFSSDEVVDRLRRRARGREAEPCEALRRPRLPGEFRAEYDKWTARRSEAMVVSRLEWMLDLQGRFDCSPEGEPVPTVAEVVARIAGLVAAREDLSPRSISFGPSPEDTPPPKVDRSVGVGKVDPQTGEVLSFKRTHWILTCEVCGVEFHAKRKDKRTCSGACKGTKSRTSRHT